MSEERDKSAHLRVGDRVRLRNGGPFDGRRGTVTGYDWRTYLCQVTWDEPQSRWSIGPEVIHEMYLDRAQEFVPAESPAVDDRAGEGE